MNMFDQPLIDTRQAQAVSSYENSTSSTPISSFQVSHGISRVETSNQGALSSDSIIPRQFPPIFHLYTVPFSRTFHLGEHRDHPVYAVSTHSGWSGNPDVVLHTGTNKNDPLLAAAEVTHTIPTTLTIHLPALPGSDQKATVEPLTAINGISRRYRFSLEVDPAGAVREDFEWRHSSGSAVKEYGCARQGWKLMRMSTTLPGNSGGFSSPGSPPHKLGGYTSSDGKEVVAVWTNVGVSMTKSWRFAFIGTGASGILGERWAVMAVMTSLLMWEQERRARSRGTAAGSGSGEGA
ncbi:hypothetical protein MKZ38_009722 [Zalerion maritima]|uniref:Uncharacterized protein n=1 Tax=Zalerion maritima TaxID=339359 RepID=A0AAD5RUC8_9PEZI|nr:hypothetical protein MKZ38_009722 [Zalerion maritima]